ncbi:MAG TPA: hypothetical protein DCF33_06080 [Saprospirales bacterium]|nr:hypothetical protein [Saprospirales bacterium]
MDGERWTMDDERLTMNLSPKILDKKEFILYSQKQVILGMKKLQSSKPQGASISQRESRYFSESARRAIVEEIENGLSKAEASRRYKVSQSVIFKWIAKYSKFYQKQLRQVVEHESESLRLKQVSEELERVYALLGREQAKSMYLEAIIEQADSSLNLDLKKNFDVPQSPLCKNKKPKNH